MFSGMSSMITQRFPSGLGEDTTLDAFLVKRRVLTGSQKCGFRACFGWEDDDHVGPEAEFGFNFYVSAHKLNYGTRDPQTKSGSSIISTIS